MGIQKIIVGIHFVRETWASRFFRRHLRLETIFTAWNGLTGRWMLGYWVDRLNGVFNEIDDLGTTLDCITTQMVEDLRRTRNYTTMGNLKKQLLRQQRNKGLEVSDKEAQDREFRQWMRRKEIPPCWFYSRPKY